MIERIRTTTSESPHRVPPRRLPPVRVRRGAGATLLAALVSSLAATGALGAAPAATPAITPAITPASPGPDAFGERTPVLETLGERHRVREGGVGDPAAFAADAELAAGGDVSGVTPLLETLPLRRSNAYGDTWIADVGLLLPSALDRDGDGFFAGFELTIDVDTAVSFLDVYALVELTDSAGFVTLGHDTAEFRVHGYSSADRYRVEVELLDDHAPGYHDLRIEVRDARDGRLLDRVSAHEFRTLAALPLEAERGGFADDDPYHTVDSRGEGSAFVAGYAAANGPFGALSLAAFVLWRRRRRAVRTARRP